MRLLAPLLLAAFLPSSALAQTLMPPGGPALCDATGGAGGQESSLDTVARMMRVRAEGAAFQTHLSHATVEYSFQAVGSYPAIASLGITYSGLLRGGGVGNAIRGEISVVASLHNVDAGVMLESQTLLDETHNDLGFAVIASGLFPPSTDFSHDLVAGTTYMVRLRVEAQGTGPGGDSDFLSGLRGIQYSCLTVAADLADTDGDGIYDVWETSGVDIDNDGIPELPADELGVDFAGNPITLDPNRKDVLVELDWFDCAAAGSDCAPFDTHSHDPRAGVLAAARDVFDAAPVSNPNGAADGIALWVQRDEAAPHQENCDLNDGCFDAVKAQWFGTAAERADPDRIAAKAMISRYSLWNHDKEPGNTSSGEADGSAGVAGDDFVVSLGSWSGNRGTQGDQIGTFIHELGHTLALGHGGGQDTNCKPNYLSVMNYIFQTAGLQPTGPGASPFYDLSATALPATAGELVEDALNEPIGIEAGPFLSFFGPPADVDGVDNDGDGDLADDLVPVQGSDPADWDQNGVATDNPAAPSDINFFDSDGCDGGGSGVPDASPDDTLGGFVDWDLLQYNFRDSPFFPVGEHGQQLEEELDRETSDRMKDRIWRAQVTRLYRYDAKFLCGVETDPEGARLAQGRYATVVNILNPGQRAARFRKSLALAFPPAEQLPGETHLIGIDELGPQQALKVDCADVRTNVFAGAFPEPVIDGFVTIQSPQPLEVQGVYTTAGIDAAGAPLGHSSIHIERYAGIDLSANLRVAKRAAFVTVPLFDNFSVAVTLFELSVANGGPADAVAVTLRDEIALQQQGGVIASLTALAEPIELPAGATLTSLTNAGAASSLDLALGDIPAGATRVARFFALVPIYRVGAQPAAVSLVNTATAAFTGYEADPDDNRDRIFVGLAP